MIYNSDYPIYEIISDLLLSNVPKTLKTANNEIETKYSYKNYSIEETDSEYYIFIDVPGYSKEEINLDFVDEKLILTGNNEKRGEFKIRIETKRFKNANFEKINADLKLGVLTITIEKLTIQKPVINWL